MRAKAFYPPLTPFRQSDPQEACAAQTGGPLVMSHPSVGAAQLPITCLGPLGREGESA